MFLKVVTLLLMSRHLLVTGDTPTTSTFKVEDFSGDCLRAGGIRYQDRDADVKFLACCVSSYSCDCIDKYCQAHPDEISGCGVLCVPAKCSDQDTNVTKMVATCDALPQRSFLARNSWIWLVLVAVVVAAIVLVAIWYVFRKKFAGDAARRHSSKRASRTRLSLGAHMNVASSVENQHKKQRKKKHSRRGSTRRSSSRNLKQQLDRSASKRDTSRTRLPPQSGSDAGVNAGQPSSQAEVQASVPKVSRTFLERAVK